MIDLLKKNAAGIGYALIAAIFSASFVLMFSPALSVQVDSVSVYLYCAVTFAAMTILLCVKKHRLIALFAVSVVVCALLLLKAIDLSEIVSEIEGIISGQQGEATALLSAFAVVMLLVSYLMISEDYGVYVLGFIALCCSAFCWVFGFSPDYRYSFGIILSLSAGLAADCRVKQSAVKAIVSISLISALLAQAIVPNSGIQSKYLAEKANDVIKFVITSLNLDRDELEQRRTFNIGTYGWRTSQESFGGPAFPTDEPVMTVETDNVLYMRGSVRYTYNGKAWIDESNDEKAGRVKRYMLSGMEGFLYRNEYENAFDLSYKNVTKDALPETAIVTMLGDNKYWALYTPNRTSEIVSEADFNIYYNNIGELFASRKLLDGDSYSLTYYSADTFYASSEYGYMTETFRDMYLSLPESIEAGVYELVSDIIEGFDTPYEKAEAISEYLKTSGRYSLTPDYVPDNKDFVSYFVLEDMRGYCIYYASALAVMARIAGLPSRYIEDYLAQPDEDGRCLLTGKDAHAWTEIYFDGVGWLTFDATPNASEGGENNSEEKNNNDWPEPSDTPDPTTTPTPTPTAEPRETPKPSDNGSDWNNNPTPTPSPKDNGAKSTPTALPNSDGQQHKDDTPQNSGKNKLAPWILLILLILAVLILIYLRFRKVLPENAQTKYNNAADKLMLWYKACLNALACEGIRYTQGDTPVSFAERAVKAGHADETFVRLTEQVEKVNYAMDGKAKDYLATAREAYKIIYAKMGMKNKAKLCLRLFKKGQGRVDIIP